MVVLLHAKGIAIVYPDVRILRGDMELSVPGDKIRAVYRRRETGDYYLVVDDNDERYAPFLALRKPTLSSLELVPELSTVTGLVVYRYKGDVPWEDVVTLDKFLDKYGIHGSNVVEGWRADFIAVDSEQVDGDLVTRTGLAVVNRDNAPPLLAYVGQTLLRVGGRLLPVAAVIERYPTREEIERAETERPVKYLFYKYGVVRGRVPPERVDLVEVRRLAARVARGDAELSRLRAVYEVAAIAALHLRSRRDRAGLEELASVLDSIRPGRIMCRDRGAFAEQYLRLAYSYHEVARLLRRRAGAYAFEMVADAARRRALAALKRFDRRFAGFVVEMRHVWRLLSDYSSDAQLTYTGYLPEPSVPVQPVKAAGNRIYTSPEWKKRAIPLSVIHPLVYRYEYATRVVVTRDGKVKPIRAVTVFKRSKRRYEELAIG